MLPWWLSGKEHSCQCRTHRQHRFNPWVGKMPWRRAWQHTPVLLPGKSHAQRMLVDYSQSVTTESLKNKKNNIRHTSSHFLLRNPLACFITIINQDIWDDTLLKTFLKVQCRCTNSNLPGGFKKSILRWPRRKPRTLTMKCPWCNPVGPTGHSMIGVTEWS